MKIFLIKALILFAVSVAVPMNAGAQATVRHTVDRGETLTSIAKKYNTTEDKIKELNPEAGQFIYVGMELMIPAGKTDAVTDNPTGQKNITPEDVSVIKEIPTVRQTEEYHDTNMPGTTSSDFRRWNPSFYIAYGFLQKPKGTENHCYTYSASIGTNYNITEAFYVGARLGYTMSSYSGLLYSRSTNTTYHFIGIPVETGYKISIIPDKFQLIPYVGIDTNIAVKGKMTVGAGESKDENDIDDIGGKISLGARAGIRFSINNFCLGGAYAIPLNDNCKGAFGENGYFEISIGFII